MIQFSMNKQFVKNIFSSNSVYSNISNSNYSV